MTLGFVPSYEKVDYKYIFTKLQFTPLPKGHTITSLLIQKDHSIVMP